LHGLAVLVKARGKPWMRRKHNGNEDSEHSQDGNWSVMEKLSLYRRRLQVSIPGPLPLPFSHVCGFSLRLAVWRPFHLAYCSPPQDVMSCLRT
jgi:hypothetical protein